MASPPPPGRPPHWDDDPDYWDVAYIDEIAIPGRTRVVGSVKNDIEKKKAKGKEKATSKHNGKQTSTFGLETHLGTKEEYDEYVDKILPLLWPVKDGERKEPLRVTHPSVQLMGIGPCFVEEVTLPEVSEDRTMTMRVALSETVIVPKPIKTGPVGPTRADRQALKQAEFDRAYDEWRYKEDLARTSPFANEEEKEMADARAEAAKQRLEQKRLELENS